MKWAIITGASSGIGRALALEFAAGSFNLLLTGRDENALNEVAGRMFAETFDTNRNRCRRSELHRRHRQTRANSLVENVIPMKRSLTMRALPFTATSAQRISTKTSGCFMFSSPRLSG